MLNWKIRYAKIMQIHPELFDPAYSVVEVGSGAFGIAQFLGRRVIGVEPHPPPTDNEHLEIVPGDLSRLPFADEEIDLVVCVDVLEHIPADGRRNAIHELLRVCRDKVIISGPCHKWAKSGEAALKDMFLRCNMPVPGWLEEHLEFGIPLLPDLILPVAETGYRFEIIANETLLQHYSGIAMDWMFPTAGEFNQKLQHKTPRVAPVLGNDWDLYYSFITTIYKQKRATSPGWGDPYRRSSRRQLTVSDRAAPQLYAVYHSDFPTDYLGRVTPIFAGDAAIRAMPGQLTDRLASGAALPNSRWSELSAVYKVWKEGPKSRVIGFAHYRRLFDFRKDPTCGVRETELPSEQWHSYQDAFFDEDVLRSVNDVTLLVARPRPVEGSIFEQYCDVHNTNDYLEIFNEISMSDGPLLKGMLAQFSSDQLYANNMFAASWPVFCELCDFWFKYLERFVAAFPARDETIDYHRRDVSFLSERIFDAWVRYRKESGTRVIELPIFCLSP